MKHLTTYLHLSLIVLRPLLVLHHRRCCAMCAHITLLYNTAVTNISIVRNSFHEC